MFEYQSQLNAMQDARQSYQSQLNSMQSGFTPTRPIEHIEKIFDTDRQVVMTVVTADNGFVLVTKSPLASLGAAPNSSVFVASNVEELRDLITSDLVSRKMRV